jgi:transposase
VLDEVGVAAWSYPTLKRRLPVYARPSWRQRLAAACAAHTGLGPASLVLFDVSTLYFETDAGDGFREPGFSKERRLDPQITIGLLTDAAGFPLTVNAFEGNKADTTTMIPTLQAFMAAHQLGEVTVVADAGMVSAANQAALEAAGPSFIRTLRGIDEHVAKAERAVAGKTAVKRNRFVRLTGASRSVNRDLEAKARALAGLKGNVTNLQACPDGTPVTAEFVIGAYHRLWHIEKSFRMSKHDLQARPIYHRKRESIEAHLSIVLAALAVSRWIEDTTSWSIKKSVRTVRRYRTIEIQADAHTVTAEQPQPTTSAPPSTPSTAEPLNTNLSQVGLLAG